jgi:hypothetical protein
MFFFFFVHHLILKKNLTRCHSDSRVCVILHEIFTVPMRSRCLSRMLLFHWGNRVTHTLSVSIALLSPRLVEASLLLCKRLASCSRKRKKYMRKERRIYVGVEYDCIDWPVRSYPMLEYESTGIAGAHGQ